MESLKNVNTKLLSLDVVKAKISENETLLLEAIKNEFTIPCLLERIEKEIEKTKTKGKELDTKDKNYAFINEGLIKSLRGLEEKKAEMKSEYEFNKDNISIYQAYIQYLTDLLPKLK